MRRMRNRNPVEFSLLLPIRLSDHVDRTSSGFPRPLIIIGAPRSGTNMLRNVLSRLPDFGTWPCDEINYIWRFGNSEWATDELTPAHARPRVRRYIRNEFRSISRRRKVRNVVEKTCANSLRVSFVDAVVPEALYIHIVRDGRDVVASAMKRWTSELNLPYVLRKARFVPPSEAPLYAMRYLRDRLYQLRSDEKRIGFWGPRFAGFEEFRHRPLHELCAMQWRECVLQATKDLSTINTDRIHRIQYEDFVQCPTDRLAALCTFIDVPSSELNLSDIVHDITSRSVGNWKSELTEKQLNDIASELDTVASF